MADRPLFDAPRPGGTPARTQQQYSVRQVNELIRGALNRHIPPTLHVVGEIGDLSRPASGHIYFSLKDSDSEIRCVIWRSAATKLRFDLSAGLDVIATGGLEVYIPRGTYQLIVTRVEPRGVGALELAFRQLKEKLEREGLFDAQRKRPLPTMPSRIAVITSPSGAAIRDIIHTIQRRYPALELLVFPVRVQGDGAAEEIAAAIEQMNLHSTALGGIDVAIVGRGGGSLEDLWAFNTEIVARAIAASAIPIISAVGHEVDFTIADFVADARAATPTAAAELLTPSAADMRSAISQIVGRVERAQRGRLALACSGFERVMLRESMARPLARIREAAQRVDEYTGQIHATLQTRLHRAATALARAEFINARFASGAHFANRQRLLAALDFRLRDALRSRLHDAARRREHVIGRLDRGIGRVALQRHQEQLRQMAIRAAKAVQSALRIAGERMNSQTRALVACDPRRVLHRGYSLTRDAKTKRVIRSIEQIRDGTRVITQVADGEFSSTAENPRQGRLFE